MRLRAQEGNTKDTPHEAHRQGLNDLLAPKRTFNISFQGGTYGSTYFHLYFYSMEYTASHQLPIKGPSTWALRLQDFPIHAYQIVVKVS